MLDERRAAIESDDAEPSQNGTGEHLDEAAEPSTSQR
jgi:hypothetical protein